MATEAPGPSPAADPKHLRAGEPVSRRHATSRSGPGILRVCAMVGDTLHDVRGEEAVEQLPGFLSQPETSVWIDLAGPTQAQVEAIGQALSLHPLIVEDVLEGNQRAKLELTNGVVHMVDRVHRDNRIERFRRERHVFCEAANERHAIRELR